ncbi:helix-turn-helix domain-containing protein [Planococcus sp. CAU13]|uniref:helix-turn-helix domain-containing protein n=1 Tax=Planococcus sp. CAU13 TaxID=1541197 RepID=UPI00052FDCD2|nr:AraC family transcriptional regulator [Planococcus sp. CAU13]
MKDYTESMVEWIEEHLTGTFSLDALSKYMGYSPYYCSFKFHQATGVSIRRYVLLRKLYLTTKELAGGRKVIDVAVAYGYSSQEAYSRAFKSVFGISPGDFQNNQRPVQSYEKLAVRSKGAENKMNFKEEVTLLQNRKAELFDADVLNIFNGQNMYDEFHSNKLMGDSDYAPFNEAMCVHPASRPVFDEQFIRLRAQGHQTSVESYEKIVIEPLKPLFENQYNYIVLWFGEDVFCQMNLLTLLAYLEQSGYGGSVFLNSFRDDEFKVDQTELSLGGYSKVYEEVMLQHQKPSMELLPVMYQAVELYLNMLARDNRVTKYIKNQPHLSEKELVKQLLSLFPELGYGDTQYIELIGQVRNK